MLKPVGKLVYFYYECSKCNQRGDEMRLTEIELNPQHYCEFCGNIDVVEPIKSIDIQYKVRIKPKPSMWDHNVDVFLEEPEEEKQDDLIVEQARALLLGSGFSLSQAKSALGLALKNKNFNDCKDLYKSAILEYDKRT